jgi:putative hydrolase of the HAD superfamily
MNAILFDLDETILDRTKSLFDFVSWQASKILEVNLGVDKTAFVERFIELDASGSVWKDKVYAELIKEFKIDGWSVSDLLKIYELCFCAFCQPKNGVIEAIRELKTLDYKLGLVSNGKTPFQERNFCSLGVSTLFDAILISESIGIRKPEIEIFHLASSKLGVAPENTVFVGDNPEVDIVGANNAGMYSIYVPGNYGASCSHADVVCSNFSNLVALVQKAC